MEKVHKTIGFAFTHRKMIGVIIGSIFTILGYGDITNVESL